MFYRKWGFVEAGTQIFQLGDDPQNDLLMKRRVRVSETFDVSFDQMIF